MTIPLTRGLWHPATRREAARYGSRSTGLLL